MILLALKAAHLIAIVCWFAGLFYLVRLFVYHTENRTNKVLTTQFELMERRLWYGITLPAAILTMVFGIVMMIQLSAWEFHWFQFKIVLLIIMYAYHDFCGRIRKGLARGEFTRSASFYRAMNELPTLFLFTIIPLAVAKTPMALPWGLAALVVLFLVTFGAIRIYRKFFSANDFKSVDRF